MGGRQRGLVDPDLRSAILGVELHPEHVLIEERTAPLQGDDYQLTYDADGYPELPACLDRRPCKP